MIRLPFNQSQSGSVPFFVASLLYSRKSVLKKFIFLFCKFRVNQELASDIIVIRLVDNFYNNNKKKVITLMFCIYYCK